MESNLFKYIWRHSRAEQIRILFVVLASLPFYFLSLDLPKDIVNRGIQGQQFEGPGSTQSFLGFNLPLGELLTGSPVRVFDGFQLEQAELLVALSLIFLALVGFIFWVGGLAEKPIVTQPTKHPLPPTDPRLAPAPAGD